MTNNESEVAIRFRMKESTHKRLKKVAKAELRSLNSQIEYFCLKGLKEYEAENSALEPGEDE